MADEKGGGGMVAWRAGGEVARPSIAWCREPAPEHGPDAVRHRRLLPRARVGGSWSPGVPPRRRHRVGGARMEVRHARCAELGVHKKSVVACALVGEPGAV